MGAKKSGKWSLYLGRGQAGTLHNGAGTLMALFWGRRNPTFSLQLERGGGGRSPCPCGAAEEGAAGRRSASLLLRAHWAYSPTPGRGSPEPSSPLRAGPRGSGPGTPAPCVAGGLQTRLSRSLSSRGARRSSQRLGATRGSWGPSRSAAGGAGARRPSPNSTVHPGLSCRAGQGHPGPAPSPSRAWNNRAERSRLWVMLPPSPRPLPPSPPARPELEAEPPPEEPVPCPLEPPAAAASSRSSGMDVRFYSSAPTAVGSLPGADPTCLGPLDYYHCNKVTGCGRGGRAARVRSGPHAPGHPQPPGPAEANFPSERSAARLAELGTCQRQRRVGRGGRRDATAPGQQ